MEADELIALIEGAFPARPMPEDTLMELAPSGTVIFLVEIAWRPMS
jgi:hypothetical protein